MADFSNVLEFMERHDIPINPDNFEKMSPQQITYETQIFERNRDGNGLSSKQQYKRGRGDTEYWKKVFPSRGRYLDVGCGQGYRLHSMQKGGFKVSGLTLSVIESELASHGVPDSQKVMRWEKKVRRDVKVSSVLNMPFKSDYFNCESCLGVLMMVPNAERIFGNTNKAIDIIEYGLREMGRVLKPGGILNTVTVGKNNESFLDRVDSYIGFDDKSYSVHSRNGGIIDEDEVGLGMLFKKAGLEVLKLKKTSNNHWFCRGRKI